MRVKLLGEDLVLFRTLADKVGLIGAYCPHRLAPLYFGRVETRRPALPLSRLEIRAERQMHRNAECAAGAAVHERGRAPRLPLRGVWRHHLDLHGIVEASTGAAGSRISPRAGRAADLSVCSIRSAIGSRFSKAESIRPTSCGCTPPMICRTRKCQSNNRLNKKSPTSLASKPPWTSRSSTTPGVYLWRQACLGNGTSLWRVNQFIMPFYTMPPGGGPESSPGLRPGGRRELRQVASALVSDEGDRRQTARRKCARDFPKRLTMHRRMPCPSATSA